MKKYHIELPIVASAVLVVVLVAGCSSLREQPSITERTDQDRDSITQVREGYDTLGRKWDEGTAVKPPEVVKPPESPPIEVKCGLVTMTKRVPGAVSLGEEFPTDLALTAQEQAGTVVVTDTIPEGADYLNSDPKAARDGNLLTWRFPSMQKGEVKNIRSYYKAAKEGQLNSCATVAAMPQTCAATFVGKPVIALATTGPESALVGSDVTYTITVSNKGNTPARDVVVTDKVPEGLTHSSGRHELTFKVGDLAPNELRVLPVALKAVQRGKVCNNAVASSLNTPQATAQAFTVIQQPGLAVLMTGDPEQFLNRAAGYTIVVTNSGDTVLKNITVTDTAPEPTSFVSVDGAKIGLQTATWIVPELAPGQSRVFKPALKSIVAGTHRNEVVATTMGMREIAQASTLWHGMGALLIEVIDDNDPVQLGESTTYTIRVTNQGTADETNIGLTAKFSDQVKPISAEGLTVGGQTMSVSKIPTLAAKESVTYKITVQGMRAGDARLKVTLTSDGLTSPVIEEESTRVY